MTLHTAHPEPIAEAAPSPIAVGHPVASFVAILVGLGFLLLGIQATGAINPRLDTYVAGGGIDQRGQQWEAVELRNDGVVSLRVIGLTWATTPTADARLSVLPAGISLTDYEDTGATGSAFAPFTLGPDERRVVLVTGTPPCGGSGSLVTGRLRVQVRMALGLEHTVAMGYGADTGGGPCP